LAWASAIATERLDIEREEARKAMIMKKKAARRAATLTGWTRILAEIHAPHGFGSIIFRKMKLWNSVISSRPMNARQLDLYHPLSGER